MKIGEKMEKCYFLKILQCHDFEILVGHSHHQDTPKNQKARHGTFFFIRITFSSHVWALGLGQSLGQSPPLLNFESNFDT